MSKDVKNDVPTDPEEFIKKMNKDLVIKIGKQKRANREATDRRPGWPARRRSYWPPAAVGRGGRCGRVCLAAY